MRRAWLVFALILPMALSGCLVDSDEPAREERHEDCWFFCFGRSESVHVHFDFFWPLLFIVLIVATIAIVAAAGGRDDGQEQQQQVIVVRSGDAERRPPADEKQR